MEICARLKLFYSATKLFSGTKYPTANLYFRKICEIKVALGQSLTCGIDVVELIASDVMRKFEKYWYVVHGLMAMATILDLRYKLMLLEFQFNKIYHDRAQFEVEKMKFYVVS